MTNPGIPIQLMEAEARVKMEAQGVSPEALDPSIVMLATHSPKDVYNASSDAIVGKMTAETAAYIAQLRAQPGEGAVTVDPSLKDAAHLGIHVQNVLHDIARPARRRDVIAGTLAGVALGAGFLAWVGKIDYDLDKLQNPNNSHLVGKPLIPGTSIVGDSSIMPGDSAESVPFIGPLLAKMPGVPDRAPYRVRVTKTVEKEVTSQKLVLRDGYRSGTVHNPVSYDLQLTGGEYKAGRNTASDLLDGIPSRRFTIKDITVTGEVSDEFNGKLGQSDQAQQELAVARGKVVADALRDEAKERGIRVPRFIRIEGHEGVLSPRQVAKIDKAAAQRHISSDELIRLYDKGRIADPESKRLLDNYIGDNRGADIKIVGLRRIFEKVTKTKTITTHGEEALGDIPGEVFPGFLGGLGGMLGLLLASMRRHGRFVQNRARKMAREAGLDI